MTDARVHDPGPDAPRGSRTSGENLLLVCFIMAPSSQELEPPANPGPFTKTISPLILFCEINQHSLVDRQPDLFGVSLFVAILVLLGFRCIKEAQRAFGLLDQKCSKSPEEQNLYWAFAALRGA